ncbi:unnamed protein product [Musa hybrid cultivar]
MASIKSNVDIGLMTLVLREDLGLREAIAIAGEVSSSCIAELVEPTDRSGSTSLSQSACCSSATDHPLELLFLPLFAAACF